MNALNTTRPFAVLWDYDGTLVDTEGLWIDIEIEMMAEYGVAWTREQGHALVGANERMASLAMLSCLDDPRITPDELSQARADRVAERVSSLPLPWKPGAEELLDALYEAGIPCAMYSASPAKVLAAGLSRMKPNRFAVVVDGEMVTRGKPAPDGYLLAAGRLGYAVRDCLIVEDSINGTAAARTSGAVVLAVPDQMPLDEYPGQVQVPTLAGLSVADIRRFFAAGAATRSTLTNVPINSSAAR
ncbi:MAG: HAD family phosphatase [Propionibacteriaceae bacterium]|jgi:HAD superfamily hydrolase (TIGR01509 family)|nr:HAD family phosphatase [Propionibacteriaceae bacterium]